MIDANSRLRLNHAEVVAKVMDGEAILINVSNGVYHSMEKVGGAAWELIADGHSLRDVSLTLAASYDAPAPDIEADVIELAGALLTENLVVPASEPAPSLPSVKPNGRQPYEKPMLNTYTDMNDLLALDPPMPGLQEIPWDENG